MKSFTFFALTLLLAYTTQKINPGQGVPKAVILEDDSYSALFSRVFDLSEGKSPFHFSSSAGTVIDDREPIQTKHFNNFGVKELNLVKHVSDTLAVFVYDGSKVVIQYLDHNGHYMLKSTLADMNTGLRKQTCTGFAFNEPRNYLYVGCSEQTSQTGTKNLIIATYDLAAEAVIHHEIVKQDDGFRIRNRLEIFITTSPQEANEEIYLIAYDQGRQHVSTRKEGNYYRAFRNVATRNLKHYYLGQVEISTRSDLDIVYDIYPYENTLLATGRYSAARGGIFIAQCHMHNADMMITCDYNTIKLTGVSEGHIQIANESRYIEANTNKKTFSVKAINGSFNDKTWNSQVVDHVAEVQYFDTEHGWIRGVTYGIHGATINYTHNVQGPEYGCVFLAFNDKVNLQFTGMTATIWEKNLLIGDNETGSVALFRLEIAENWIAGFNLKEGENKITITAKDTDNSLDAEGTIIVTDDIFDFVKLNDIKPVKITASKTGTIPIDSETIESGNDITVSATSKNTDALKIVDTYNTQQLDIEWNEEHTGDYFFDKDKAVIEAISQNNKQLVFSICHKDGRSKVKCDIFQKYAVPADESVVNHIISLGSSTIAYTVNRHTLKTRVLIANKDEVHAHFFKTEVVSMKGIQHLTKYIVTIAFANEVLVYSINSNDIQEWDLHTTLNAESYGVRNFCPRTISHHLPTASPTFDILSHCKTRSHFTSVSSVFRYSYLHFSNQNELPLSNLDIPVSICSFGEEILVSTNVRAYGLSINDNFAYASVPIGDLNLKQSNFNIDCIDGAGAAVIYGNSKNQQSGLIKTAWIIRGGNGDRQDRRYPLTWAAFGDTLKSFSFLEGIITVVMREGDVSFIESLLEPVIHIEAQAVTTATEVEVEVTLKNKAHTSTKTVTVTVEPAAVENKRMFKYD